ncbi:hypothetical protein, variant [Blastomyces dermatitidis ER-3]|uniref:F-box domain-containing protein, variant n=2 Tax=Ajellomyces dermatitidis TaxID=5039 RepID=A0A0J9ER74_AJEDA|nr:hypothetical protein, variant [Blastomyces dermatitidis ER-3]KMW68803.1 F-box domain-containing protein, variant [Blastomyces dermatitidis ATCC 18188]OAT01312.1 hypothetical protein, variant [Blastomyces dermatitidis ER-3]
MAKGWPPYGIPVELFACVAAYLSRQDICNLRLVNKECAFKLQRVLFRTAVVPFGPMIYSSDEASDEKIDLFETLGGCVSRFGLSFELDQIQLFDPPEKVYNNTVKTFWGEYEWPKPDYVEYDYLRRVEEVGDQAERMKRAFRTLTNVSEFALSFDTGYGWLNPPTLVDDSLEFEGKRSVFCGQAVASAPRNKRVASISSQSLKEYLESILPEWASKSLYRLKDAINEDYLDSPRLSFPRSRRLPIDPTIERGKTYGEHRAIGDCGLYPRNPTRAQTEWLLETSWAAQATLGSCIYAVIDAKSTFQRVHTLNISSISSGLLGNLNQPRFFEAFPCLTTIILLVIPDWKESDMTWDSQSPIKYIAPSAASTLLTRLLENVISHLVQLKRLTVGYIGGGEHAKGEYCRNQHILPAPITYFAQDAANGRLPEPPLKFPHIKTLTFKNCWFSPILLIQFFKSACHSSLECLKFDSCSLTAVPGTLPRPYVSNKVRPSCTRDEYYLQELREGTWSDIINQFTPALSLSEQMASMGLKDSPPPREDVPPCLRQLEFYPVLSGPAPVPPAVAQHTQQTNQQADDPAVSLQPTQQVQADTQHQNATMAALPPGPIAHEMHVPAPQIPETGFEEASERRSYIDCRLNGTIVQCIGSDEEQVLECAFGLTMGWGSWDDIEKRREVVSDGFKQGGAGRFSGVIVGSDRGFTERRYSAGPGCYRDVPGLWDSFAE